MLNQVLPAIVPEVIIVVPDVILAAIVLSVAVSKLKDEEDHSRLTVKNHGDTVVMYKSPEPRFRPSWEIRKLSSLQEIASLYFGQAPPH